MQGRDLVDLRMSSELQARLQVAALIGGGLLITAAATLTWMESAASQLGIEFVEGKITFALGGVSVLLGILRIINKSDEAKITATLLGGWLSIAVIMLALAKFADIRAYDHLLGFVKIEAGSGLYLTMVGGFIAGAGSVLGFLPTRPDQLPTNDGASERGPRMPLHDAPPHAR